MLKSTWIGEISWMRVVTKLLFSLIWNVPITAYEDISSTLQFISSFRNIVHNHNPVLSSSSLFFDPDKMPVPKKRKKKKVKQEESTDVVEVPKGEITREPQLNLFSDFLHLHQKYTSNVTTPCLGLRQMVKKNRIRWYWISKRIILKGQFVLFNTTAVKILMSFLIFL